MQARTTAVAAIFEKLASRPATRRKLGAGETLFRAGDRVKAMYVIRTGQLRLVRISKAGSEVTLHRAGAGESFAEPSLFAERYHCDAVADTTTEVLAYPKMDIISGFAEHPDRMMVLLRHLGGQIQALRSRAEIVNVRSARERLITYFRVHAPADGDVLTINPTWKQIATEIGLTHEALYRALAQLQRSGLIQRDGRKVKLTRQ